MDPALKLSAEVRQAVDRSSLSRYEICKRLAFSESTMSRFMAGKSGLSMATLDRLAALLDLHIVVGERTSAKKIPDQEEPRV